MSEVQKKKVDKTLVTAICLCVGLVLFVIGVIVLPEPIIGAVQLSQGIEYIEESTDIRVVLNSPKQSGGILADAEHIMDEPKAGRVMRISALRINATMTTATPPSSRLWWRLKL